MLTVADAQFGDEDEDDEAAPMEGLADALPDTGGGKLMCIPQSCYDSAVTCTAAIPATC